MRRFFLIFLALWLILPLFGWRSLSVFGWAKDGGGTISECVDTLTWVDEWWTYTYTYKSFSQTDTSVKIARGLTSNGHYHLFKLGRLFENGDSIYIDSILCLYPWSDWSSTATDSDTVVFSIDTLKPVDNNNHRFYSLEKVYISASAEKTLRNIGIIRSPSFAIIRLYRKTGSHNFYHYGFVVFYKKYR
ncbi:hypothetical protein DRQ17_00575 [bacterium]|nr:MAG: hypothetical protein DRQ17_00575 [bacterium]